MTLIDACRVVMGDKGANSRYPGGMTALEVLDEIRSKYGNDAFALCTWLDVHDELTEFYGAPR